MMANTEGSRRTYIFWSTLLGLISFLISGLLSCIVSLHTDQTILAMLISGGIGALLLGVFLRKGKAIAGMALAGALGMPAGLLIAFALFGGLGELLSSIGVSIGNTGILDLMGIMLMVALCGAAVGGSVYGKKALSSFFIVCGIAAIPFGALVMALNSGASIKSWLESLFEVFGKIDLNALAIALALGAGMGLSIGLFDVRSQGPFREDDQMK